MDLGYRIETDRLILRCFEKTDLHAHVAVLSNWEVTKWASNNIPFPYTLEDGEKYIAEARTEFTTGESLRFAVVEKATGLLMGNIRLFTPLEDTSEVGYGLGPSSWGKGYATEALQALAVIAFEGESLRELQAQTSAENAGSRRVLEKAGFMHKGEVPKEISRCGHAHGCSEFYVLTRQDWQKI